ncbi:MAG TPA: radical SAM protein [Desulfobacteraceae bacterium]|nr:radical SAM protein [Desulfobacteraceae bacterium]
MKALMISANTEYINMPTMPLGLACVTEATRRAGHEAELVDLFPGHNHEETIKRSIHSFSPDIIGISVRNIDDQCMENPRFLLDQARIIISSCRKFSDVPVVIGGAGYSIFPESALKYLGADMGIEGEGEACFPALLDCLQHGRSLSGLPGLYLRDIGIQGHRAFEKALDRFHMPEMDLFSAKVYKEEGFWLPVQTRRGCPMNCSYCSTSNIEGNIIRRRSPESVVEWLAKCVEAGFHRFYFVDSIFNLPPSYALSLCNLICEVSLDVEWRCILYPGNINETLIKAMKNAGCSEISLGFESGCDRILKEMNKRFTRRDILRASSITADYGIRRMGFLLLGGPGENEDSVMESLYFVDSLDLESTMLTLGIRIYPDTKLAKTASMEGIISHNDDLLIPKFYIVKGLQEWLKKTVDEWIKDHPDCIM